LDIKKGFNLSARRHALAYLLYA